VPLQCPGGLSVVVRRCPPSRSLPMPVAVDATGCLNEEGRPGANPANLNLNLKSLRASLRVRLRPGLRLILNLFEV
jgi:hypothetical protein